MWDKREKRKQATLKDKKNNHMDMIKQNKQKKKKKKQVLYYVSTMLWFVLMKTAFMKVLYCIVCM